MACYGGAPQDTVLIDFDDIFGNNYCGVSAQHHGQISLRHLALSFISSKIMYFKQRKSLWIVFFPN